MSGKAGCAGQIWQLFVGFRTPAADSHAGGALFQVGDAGRLQKSMSARQPKSRSLMLQAVQAQYSLLFLHVALLTVIA